MRLFRLVSLAGLVAASACLSDPFAPSPLDPDERAALARSHVCVPNVTDCGYHFEARNLYVLR